MLDKKKILAGKTAADVLSRFLRYVKYDTASDPEKADAGVQPSTEKQRVLAKALLDELKLIGVSDCVLTDKSYIFAKIPASKSCENAPTIAFSAHFDTSSEAPSENINVKIVENYDGKSLLPCGETPFEHSDGKKNEDLKGDTLICTDGKTLLGADDKAGIAEIMTMAQRLAAGEFEHGNVELLFTPDEETGHGMDGAPLDQMSAQCFFTLDGSEIGEVEFECFNAMKVKAEFFGKARHLGSARPDFVNAIDLACDFVSFLPKHESPATTDGRLGYYCATSVCGNSEAASVTLYLRDFDADGMKHRVEFAKELAAFVAKKHSGANFKVKATEQYRNMSDVVQVGDDLVELVKTAVERAGAAMRVNSIRGGTDGARVCELMKIPAPNIFTGGCNFHSCNEWASLTAMAVACETACNIAAAFAKADVNQLLQRKCPS